MGNLLLPETYDPQNQPSDYTSRMGKKTRRRKDRYDTSGNPEGEFVDDAKTILVNKLGITELEPLQLREERALAKAYEALLGQVRIDTPLRLLSVCCTVADFLEQPSTDLALLCERCPRGSKKPARRLARRLFADCSPKQLRHGKALH